MNVFRRLMQVLQRRGKQHCPLNNVPGSAFYNVQNYWEQRGKWRTCTHCGSIHPEDLIAELIKDPTIMHKSTKPHKWYVDLPGVKNATEGPIKLYTEHLNAEQLRAVNAILTTIKK